MTLEVAQRETPKICLRRVRRNLAKNDCCSSNFQHNPRAHKNKIGTSTPWGPPPKTRAPPPLKRGVLWAWGISSGKNQKMPGAHKIGAAISGPGIAGGKIMCTFRAIYTRI